MTCDLKIVNSKVFAYGELLHAGIAINHEKIAAIAEDSMLPNSDRTIDARGNLIIPGLIDVHVHFRDPGFTQKEDFITGSQAAAAGGVTTVIDEPNNQPTTTTLEALEQKKGIAHQKSVVDFSFSVGLNPRNINSIPDFVSHGIHSFDIFEDGMGEELSVKGTKAIIEALTAVRQANALACMTVSIPDLNRLTIQELTEKKRNDMGAHSESWPSLGEGLCAARNSLLAKHLGTRIHLRQISSELTLDVLRRRDGFNITSEVSPHHLLLATKQAEDLGPYGKVLPPIRRKEDTERLWEALACGEIDIVATDHAPHTKEEKNAGMHNIWDAPPGLTGVETMLPLMLTQMNKGRISLARVIDATSTRPAQIFNLYPKKGTIQIGSDADLVVVDINRKGKIQAKNLHSKAGWTPFEGWEFHGLPVMTMLRGEIVMKEGTIVARPGCGQFISHQRSQASTLESDNASRSIKQKDQGSA